MKKTIDGCAWLAWFVGMWASVIVLSFCWGWKLHAHDVCGYHPDKATWGMWIYNSLCQACLFLRLLPGDYALHSLERKLKSRRLLDLIQDSPQSIILLLAQAVALIISSFVSFTHPTWYPLTLMGLLGLNILWIDERVERNQKCTLALARRARIPSNQFDLLLLTRLNAALGIWRKINAGTIAVLLAVITGFLLSPEAVLISAAVLTVASIADWSNTWDIYSNNAVGEEAQS